MQLDNPDLWKDIEHIRLALNYRLSDPSLLETLKDESRLSGFKLDELKIIIRTLKDKSKVGCRLPTSGSKSLLTKQISSYFIQRITNSYDTISTRSHNISTTIARGYNPPSKIDNIPTLASPIPKNVVNTESNEIFSNELFLSSQDPFLEIQKQISVTPFTNSIRSNRIQSKFFFLEAKTLELIKTNKLLIQIRLFGMENDIMWTQEHSLVANGKLIDLTKTSKKIRANSKNPLITPKSPDLTSYLVERNYIEFTPPKEAIGAVVIQLVKPVDINELMTKIPKKKFICTIKNIK